MTSNYTFSGAEEVTYDQQKLKRATVIGEVTGGGANPGDLYRLHDYVQVIIPNGRVVHPVTGTNWAGGVGVRPDIEVPADEAFDVAYELALKALSEEAELQQREENRQTAGYKQE